MKLEISKEQLIEDYTMLGSIRGVANKYGVTPSTIKSRLDKYQIEYTSWYGKITEKKTYIPSLIDMLSPLAEKPLQLTGDWAITSDWHIPALSVKWYERLKEVCIRDNIKNLIIGGDLINFDLLSYYWERNPTLEVPTVEKEFELTRIIWKELEGIFDNIVWLMGNHEERYMKILRNGVGTSSLYREINATISKYIQTNLPFLYLDGIRITHPRTYRQLKLSVARDLSNKYQCSVLQAHGHFLSLGYSSGGYVIGDTGGLFEADRVQYLMGADTTHPVWNNGFMVYKNKLISVYGEGIGVG